MGMMCDRGMLAQSETETERDRDRDAGTHTSCTYTPPPASPPDLLSPPCRVSSGRTYNPTHRRSGSGAEPADAVGWEGGAGG